MQEVKDNNSVKTQIHKKWWFWVILVPVFYVIFYSMGNMDKRNPEKTETHIYDNPEVKDVINGSRTAKIGEYSIIRIDSEKVTDEALTDWYFNYVNKNDFNWCMILYTDKDDNMGVYANTGMLEKNLLFGQDEYGDYFMGDTSKSILYEPADNNTLKIVEIKE